MSAGERSTALTQLARLGFGRATEAETLLGELESEAGLARDVALGREVHAAAVTAAVTDLVRLVESAGFRVHDVRSWNVLLRPVAMVRRRSHQADESEMQPVHPLLNAGLRSVVAVESWLPVQSLPGISLVVRAVRD